MDLSLKVWGGGGGSKGSKCVITIQFLKFFFSALLSFALASLLVRLSSWGTLWQLQTYRIFTASNTNGVKSIFLTKVPSGQVWVLPSLGSDGGRWGWGWWGISTSTERGDSSEENWCKVCIKRERDAEQTKITGAPWQLCNLGHFFVLCMAFPFSTLPAPRIARTVFIHSVFPIKPTTVLWNEKCLLIK